MFLMIMNHGRHCAEKRDIYSGRRLRLALILLLSLPLSRRRVSSWARETDRGSAKTVHVTDSAQGGVVSDPEYLLLQEHFQNQLKDEIRFIALERDQEFIQSHFYVWNVIGQNAGRQKIYDVPRQLNIF